MPRTSWFWILLCGVALYAPAAMAADPPDPTLPPQPAPQASPPPADGLGASLTLLENTFAEGKQLYVLQGDREAASTAFASVWALASEDQRRSEPVVADAMLYLGEIQFLQGDETAARATFRMALEAQPRLDASPIAHPVEVIGMVEIMRRGLAPIPATLPTAPRPKPRAMPWWGYAPLGIPQFGMKKPVRGTLYLTLQLASVTASTVLWLRLDDFRDENAPRSAAESDAFRRRQVPLRAAQWGSAAVGWTSWVASAADGGVTWRKQERLRLGLALAPRPGGAGLLLTGQW